MATTIKLLLMNSEQYYAELPQWPSLSCGDNKTSDLFHPENNKNGHYGLFILCWLFLEAALYIV